MKSPAPPVVAAAYGVYFILLLTISLRAIRIPLIGSKLITATAPLVYPVTFLLPGYPGLAGVVVFLLGAAISAASAYFACLLFAFAKSRFPQAAWSLLLIPALWVMTAFLS